MSWSSCDLGFMEMMMEIFIEKAPPDAGGAMFALQG